MFVTLAALLLAGCTNDGPAAEAVTLGDGTQVELVEVENTATTGSISGVVVDEAIRPLAGVNVSLVGPGLTTVSNQNGLFVFEDVVPGLAVVKANGTGFLAAQTSTDVFAGNTAKVRIVLLADPTPQPYHQTLKFDWYDEAGVALVDFAVDLFGRGIINETVPPFCDVCYFEFEVDGPFEDAIVEAVWEDNLATPAENATEYYWTLRGVASNEYESDYFYSPGRALAPGATYAGETLLSINLAADENWVTYQQEAELFVTIFYLEGAPSGWSFVAGDR